MTIDLVVGFVGIMTSIITVVTMVVSLRNITAKSAERVGEQSATIARIRIDLDDTRSDFKHLEERTRETENGMSAMSEKIDSLILMVREIKEDLDKR